MWVCVCVCVCVSISQSASQLSVALRESLSVWVSPLSLSLSRSLLSIRQNNKRKTQLSSWPFCRGHQTQSIIMKLNGLLRSVLTDGWLLLIGGHYEFRSSRVFPANPTSPHLGRGSLSQTEGVVLSERRIKQNRALPLNTCTRQQFTLILSDLSLKKEKTKRKETHARQVQPRLINKCISWVVRKKKTGENQEKEAFLLLLGEKAQTMSSKYL